MSRRPQRRFAPRRSLLAAALVGSLWAKQALADDPPPITCEPRPPSLACQVSLEKPMLEPSMVQRLRSGLLNRFLYRIYIRRLDDNEPVSLSALQILEAYDLWDEVFYVSEDPQGSDRRTIPSERALASHLGRFEGLAISQPLPPGHYYADLIVELNPLSEADEAEIRSWIARNRGGHRSFASGERNLFGTFVSLFLNIRPGNAEWSLRARSKPFTIAPP